jgi:hypothetical protein
MNFKNRRREVRRAMFNGKTKYNTIFQVVE